MTAAATATATAIFPYSVKIDQSAKGTLVIVDTYNNDAQTAKNEAIKLFLETRKELKNSGVKVLEA